MPFDFNLYSSLLLPLVIQGVIFSLILLIRGLREDRLADRLLALLIFLLTLRPMNWMLGFAGWYDSHDAFTTFIFYFPWNWFLLLGPLTYFYFQSLTNQDFTWQKRDWLFFVPTLLAKFIKLSNFGFDVIWSHQVKGESFPFHYETRGAMDLFSGLSNVLDWISPFWLLGFLGYTLWQYQRYRRYVAENFSNLAPLDFTWLRNFLVAFSLLQLIYYGFQVADSLSGEGLSYIQNWYSFFAWGLIIYYLSIAGLLANAKEHYFLKYHPSSLLSPTQENSPPKEVEIDSQQKEKLEQLMRSKAPYLSPGLSLQELSDLMKLPSQELSRLINGAYGQNFNDFINRYRIEAVKKALLDPSLQHLSLLGIALDAGFNSKATFNRVFKEHTGLSPSAWRKQVSQVDTI